MPRTIAILALTAAAVAGGCTATPADDVDVGGEVGDNADAVTRCSSSAECDDSIECTVDTCGADRACQHNPIDAMCADGESCVPGRGCIAGACTVDGDCDDGFACTVDTCGVGNLCENQPVDALCETLERCDPAAGCVPNGECLTAADCDDTIWCTVDDCVIGNLCQHTTNNALCETGEVCGADRGCYTPMPCDDPSDCTDFAFCDGIPRCDPEFGCQEPETPRDCNDSDVCTIDSCDPAAGTSGMCAYEVNCGLSECLADHPECLWNGCFDLDATVAQRCALGAVNYSFNRVCFELRGPILYISPSPLSMLSDGNPMELVQAGTPTGTAFDASVVVSGGCIENYRIEGAFPDPGGVVDPSHFEATFTATYVDHDGYSCSFSGCRNQAIPITGTRI
ncbi:MAG: hypothetical protein HY907_04035 [Deltaproteobacteria bacterium]|nr:hypothetical protein [Deltaproteobacteria bacterium]